jgi:hypothetical protein
MRSIDFKRRALCTGVAAAFMAGCAAAQPTQVSTSAGRMLPATRQRAADGSWMAPDAAKQNLLYVSDWSEVTVYAYPQGTREGRLGPGLYYGTNGECVDRQGDVFVLNYIGGSIYEYAHGAKQYSARLDTPSPASACAVDPTTGNLAATEGSAVAIYKDALGEPKLYHDSRFSSFAFCDYDAEGNLFVDGTNLSDQVALVELPKTSPKFEPISLDQTIHSSGGVQWDGNHLVVGDSSDNVLYRFSIVGGKGTEVGATALGGSERSVRQFRIRDGRVIVPAPWFKSGHTHIRSEVLYYDYPAGGNAIGDVHKGVVYASGAVVSPAQQ